MTQPIFDYAESQHQVRRKRLIEKLRAKNSASADVLAVMEQIPRHHFLPKALQADAYEDAALPIGEQQTISMPNVVAKMTSALNVQKTHKVLEIGTGSGYQLAILCKLARRVYSVERHENLSLRANKILAEIGFHNYTTKVGDGTLGWPEQAPFDRIIVTAVGPKVPQSLLNQLAVGGTLITPVGPAHAPAELVKCEKLPDGTVEHTNLGTVVFVPLVGKEGTAA